MRDRKLRDNEEQNPNTSSTPRRSPRFLHGRQARVEYPETPKLAEMNPGPDPFSTPLLTPIAKTHKNGVGISKSSAESSGGSRRSARLDCVANLSCLDSPELRVPEKRVTRSSSCGGRLVKNQSNDCGEISKKVNRERSSKEPIRSTSRGNVIGERSSLQVNKSLNNEINSEKDSGGGSVKGFPEKVKGHKVGFDLCKQGKPEGDVELSANASERDVEKIRVEGNCDFVKGWTEEQELTLRRAYAKEKPTPHFWKKVAKMVPGKSAEDCFNRIHSYHITPSQTRKRSRSNKNLPSPVPFSASKLLHSPTGIKAKNPRARNKTLKAQKNVRHLLEKQRIEDQDYKADLFSILEPTTELLSPSLDSQETTPFASPLPSQGKQFSGIEADFVSPPVLKQIKNKALHEKYIDKIHSRDAKRKAQSSRKGKSVREKVIEVIPVRVAKDALFVNVQDAIDKLQKVAPNTDCEVDDEDDGVMSHDDENGIC